MNFLNELFSNNSMYLTLSKEMSRIDFMYNKFISNNVSKINKIKYNSLLSELLKDLEGLEEYEKCDELLKMFLEVPEDYKQPKCSFDINVVLKERGFDLIPEEELVNMKRVQYLEHNGFCPCVGLGLQQLLVEGLQSLRAEDPHAVEGLQGLYGRGQGCEP